MNVLSVGVIFCIDRTKRQQEWLNSGANVSLHTFLHHHCFVFSFVNIKDVSQQLTVSTDWSCTISAIFLSLLSFQVDSASYLKLGHRELS